METKELLLMYKITCTDSFYATLNGQAMKQWNVEILIYSDRKIQNFYDFQSLTELIV